MKAKLLAVLFFSAIISPLRAQTIATGYNPILKESPYQIFTIQHPDNNYLVFGDINYYENELCGSLIKVDGNGKRLAGFAKVATDQFIERVIVLADGKILIIGQFKFINGEASGPIARLNSDGTVDNTFNTDIKGRLWAMALQSTGKIVVVHIDNDSQWRLKRLNPDGSIDNTFADTYVGTQFHLSVTSDDKIYTSAYDYIRRLMPNGSNDNTFSFDNDLTKTVSSFAIQPDGKLIVTNTQANLNPYTVIVSLRRYNANGSRDNTFTSGTTTDGSIERILVRSNGKVAIAGTFRTFNSQRGSVMELNDDGTFNRVILASNSSAMHSLIEDSGLNVVVAGSFTKVDKLGTKRFIARIKPTYDFDASFKVPVTRAGTNNTWSSLNSQSSGKLIVGMAFPSIGIANDTSHIVRLMQDGSVDATFHAQLNETLLSEIRANISSVIVQPDDKILIAGNGHVTDPATTLARLMPDGQIDNAFKAGSSVDGTYSGGTRKIIVKNSKIYVAGVFDHFNGVACNSFVILDLAGNVIGPQQNGIPTNSSIGDFVLQSDGKIIFVGTFNVSSSDTRNFIRINPDGSLDDSFVLKAFPETAGGLQVDSHDRILLNSYNGSRSLITRLLPNGENDSSFDLTNAFQGGLILQMYFSIPLKEDRIAIGGYFASYKGSKTMGIAILDKDLNLVPMETPYDSISYGLIADYSNNILHVGGRFSNYGQNYSGVVKVVFPVESIVSGYEGKAISDSAMKLSWEGEFDGADRIIIEASPDDALNFSTVATISPNFKSYELTGLKEVTPYHVRIKGVNDNYTSPYLTTVDTTDITAQVALPPTNVTLSSFTANWTDVTGTDSCAVQLSDDNFATVLSGYDNVVVKGSSLAVDGLTEGMSYQYRVKRFKNKKSSAFSKAVNVNIITGIEDGGSLSVSVYPNPVSDHVVVEMPSDAGDASVVINSLSGGIMARYDITDSSSRRLDLSELPAGMYVLVVSSQGKSRSFKLVRALR